MSNKDDRQAELIGYWTDAVKSPFGIRICTPDRRLLSQQLYRARAAHGGFENMVIIMPKGKDEIWITRRDADENA